MSEASFAVGVVKFCETLPNTIAGRKIAGQLIDASTSVAANYRAACRGYTRPIFVSKLAIRVPQNRRWPAKTPHWSLGALRRS